MKNTTRTRRIAVQPKIAGLAVFTLMLFIAGTVRAASPGAADLTYGNRGTAAFNKGNVFQEARAVAVQTDGKVVLGGYVRTCVGPTCTYDFMLVRFNTNGTLDTGFGTDGSVVTDHFSQDERISAMVIQPDGKIVVAGGPFGNESSATNIQGFKVFRYLSNGTLDPDFGSGGRVYESFDDVGGIPMAMLLEPDGKIVVAGTDNVSMLFVARFNTNGSLDSGFGTSGRIASNVYDVDSVAMARQSDGKIVIAGSSSPSGTTKIVRFNSDGTIDGGYGVGGLVTSIFPNSFAPTIATQTDNKLIVSGTYSNNSLRTPPLRRFNENGSEDSSLVPNHGEIIAGACISCTQRPSKILMLADGRFYLAGYNARFTNGRKTIAVSRYLSNGSLDMSYGFRGSSQLRHSNTPTETTLWTVLDAALQSDGKVVVAATGDLPISNFGQQHYLAVRLTSTVTAPSTRGDFDGDRKTDFAVFRPSSRFWYVLRSLDSSIFSERFGADGDVLTPGDYNYDLKTDLAVRRPSDNGWYISPSLPSGGGTGGGPFGVSGDIAVPDDYDGDGYTDLATYRPSDGTWNVKFSSRNREGGVGNPVYQISFPFGASTDRPVPGDYDGDGRADFAVFRPASGDWYILRSSDGLVSGVNFGLGTDLAVPADYDGDLKTDVAVFREGAWYYLRSSDGGFVGIAWGIATDKPAPGDYDGDGKYDVAVYRPSEGAWYALRSSDSGVTAAQWGISEDIPIPFTFVR